jgi:predicted  nucleic acid-binding Zn-ribbon protein
MSKNEQVERLEQLNARRDALRDQLVRAQTNVETAQTELSRLQVEAQEKWGTSDVGVLEKKLEDMQGQNERALAQYEQEVHDFEAQLAKVRQQLQNGG